MSVSMQVPKFFEYCSFAVSFEIKFFQYCFDYTESLKLHMNLRRDFSISIGILIVIELNL